MYKFKHWRGVCSLGLRMFSFLLILILFPVKNNAEGKQTGIESQKIVELDTDYWFVVWLKDDSKIVKHLADKPMVRYRDDCFTFISKDFIAEYASNDVRKFTLSDNANGDDLGGLNEICIPASKLSQFSSDSLTITDGTPGGITLIYNISGILIGSYVADQIGTTFIPLEYLPTGVLIIKSETLTYKILKK